MLQVVEVAKINEITPLQFFFMQKVFDMGFSILKTYPVQAFPVYLYLSISIPATKSRHVLAAL